MTNRRYFTELYGQHVTLRKRIRDLSQAFATGDSPLQTLDELHALDTLLLDHYALEEKDGYMSEALEVAPHLSRQAMRLEQQHARFCRRMRELARRGDAAAELPDEWKRVGDSFRRLARELLVHEDAENALIYEAFRELGSGG